METGGTLSIHMVAAEFDGEVGKEVRWILEEGEEGRWIDRRRGQVGGKEGRKED